MQRLSFDSVRIGSGSAVKIKNGQAKQSHLIYLLALIMVLAIVVVFVFSSLVDRQNMQALIAERDSSAKEVSALKRKLDEFSVEVDDMRNSVAVAKQELSDERSHLHQVYEELADKSRLLATAQSELSGRSAALSRATVEAAQKKLQLRRVNLDLTRSWIELRNTERQLSTRIAVLSRTNGSLKATLTAQSTPSVPAVVALTNSNVRTGDSTAYSRVGILREGRRAKLLGVSTRSTGWFYIEMSGGHRGFIAPFLVKTEGNVNRLRRFAPPALPPTSVPAPPVAAPVITDIPPVENHVPAPPFQCKRTCGQMSSCDEAYYNLRVCGNRSLDRDKDGIPCESICR